MATTRVSPKAAAKKPANKSATGRTTVTKPAKVSKSKSGAGSVKLVQPAKKTTTKKSHSKKTASKSNKNRMRSFHLYKDDQDFTSFKITRQTVYWLLLVAFIVFAQLWIIRLQIDVSEMIYEQQLSAASR